MKNSNAIFTFRLTKDVLFNEALVGYPCFAKDNNKNNLTNKNTLTEPPFKYTNPVYG